MIASTNDKGEHMSRPSDAIKEVRSYVVSNDRTKGLTVVGSHWVPGYSAAHKSTPIEAIDHAIESAEQKMTEATSLVVELHDLRATQIAQEWEPAPSGGHLGPGGERLI